MPYIVGAGTTSALKIRAITLAYEHLYPGIKISPVGFEIIPTDVKSVVSNQPFGFDEMLKGAMHRAVQAQKVHDADVGVGIESGLVKVEDNWFDVPCVVVAPRLGSVSFAFGALFPIPTRVVLAVNESRTELGHIVQVDAGGGEKDPHQWFSYGEVSRDEVVMQAILCALAPLRHPKRYK